MQRLDGFCSKAVLLLVSGGKHDHCWYQSACAIEIKVKKRERQGNTPESDFSYLPALQELDRIAMTGFKQEGSLSPMTNQGYEKQQSHYAF